MKDLRAKLAEMPVKAEELREQHLEDASAFPRHRVLFSCGAHI